jgi:hypothetical protein
VLAADQFIMRPPAGWRNRRGRTRYGDEVRTVIAGYHWFTDWGRDTMISLEGLTLTTGRYVEAGYIPDVCALRPRRLDPNMFPKESAKAVPHRRRHALVLPRHRSSRQTSRDTLTLAVLYPTLKGSSKPTSAARRHPRRRARRIADQGADGVQLTWMDAKVDGWVVTPRRGKAVEINALWFSALRLMRRWADDFGRRRGGVWCAGRSRAARLQRALLVRRRWLSVRHRRRGRRW